MVGKEQGREESESRGAGDVKRGGEARGERGTCKWEKKYGWGHTSWTRR